MPELKPSCPYLPPAEAQMSHRCLTELKTAPRDVFYFTALKYGNYLWQNGHSGRALLAITRALYTDLDASHPILDDWPLPYAAIHWITQAHSSQDFPGNPRISFQHQATRIRGERAPLRQARAWAAWKLICLAQPDLPGDPSQSIIEPTTARIAIALQVNGQENESEQWLELVAKAST